MVAIHLHLLPTPLNHATMEGGEKSTTAEGELASSLKSLSAGTPKAMVCFFLSVIINLIVMLVLASVQVDTELRSTEWTWTPLLSLVFVGSRLQSRCHFDHTM